MPDVWLNLSTKVAGNTIPPDDVNTLMANIRLMGGNGILVPSSDIETLHSQLSAISTDIHSIVADYTVLDDDGYGLILVNSTSGKVTVTFPTAADNTDRQIIVKATHNGGEIAVTGESAELLDDANSVSLHGKNDYIKAACDGTKWHILNMVSTFDTGWINRSDWTNVHCGSVEVAYDGLSGSFTVGEVVSDGTETGIITADSGSVLKLKMVTNGGDFTNDTVITGATSGATADVNGDTKNSDTHVFHNHGKNILNLKTEIYISSDGTDNNAKSLNYYNIFSNTEIWGGCLFQVDTNNFQFQTGGAGLVVLQDDGSGLGIDTEDYYYKVLVRRTI